MASLHIFLKSVCIMLLPFFNLAFSQTITHEPFVGAVTDNSARIYVRTSSAATVNFILSADSVNFSNPVIASVNTIEQDDSSGIAGVSGLLPDTKYYYKTEINSIQASGIQSFITFPTPGTAGNFTFTFGSCQATAPAPVAERVFDKMILANPRFFLQCGDWEYPDNTDNFPTDNNFFSLDYAIIQQSYRSRYSHPNMNEFLKHFPVDYLFDDHDYMNDNSARDFTPEYTGSVFLDHPNPPGARENIIKAYTQYFPSYPLVDTSEGIFHSFVFGNIEVFMCDDRSSRSPNLECFVAPGDPCAFPPGTNTIKFNPPPGHSILGQTQMDWLVNGLKNSTAKWKFVVTGVAFNKGYKAVLDYAMQPCMQNISIPGVGSGKNLATSIVDAWVGFPEDQERLIDECFNNNITNVIFLTSDSHTSAMDDGSNSGFPELMSGNLSITNSRLANIMKTFGFNVWNRGGQGVNNSNYNDAFGKIDVFGNDSVCLSIIDTLNTIIASMTIYDGVLPSPSSVNEISLKSDMNLTFSVFPNPAAEKIQLLFASQTIPLEASIEIYTSTGVRLHVQKNANNEVSTKNFLPGTYFCVVKSQTGKFAQRFVIAE